MLRNAKNQIITLNAAQSQICAIGMKDSANGYNTPERRARERILKPLRETLEPRDPCGRETNGMFSLGTRAKLIH